MGNYKFVNPYNFVPLANGKSKALPKALSKNGTYTGVIEYSLLTKTPLFIPNTSNDNVYKMNQKPKDDNDNTCAEDHKSYDFFTYTNLTKADGPTRDVMPVIPGSEIRGMFRSYYEILTNSCMSAVDDKVVLSKRTNECFKPGLLKKEDGDHYDLYAATDNQKWLKPDEEMDHFKEGQKINEGYILKGESGPKKKQGRYHCFCLQEEDGKPKKPKKKDISLDTLDKVLERYERNNKEAYSKYSEQYEEFKNDKSSEDIYFPVYYSCALDDHWMLSPACITREVYSANLDKLLKTYCACENENNLCPACSLFGMIGDNYTKTSQIRFSDLTCDMQSATDCYMDKVTLAPLSSPKLNNMEFYLKRPANDAVFWTYDYYIDAGGNIYPYKGEINGRKFFWHNMEPNMENHDPSNQNITVRPIKPKVFFNGKLYFHDISKTQLDQLIFLLNGGDEEAEITEKKHGYKLGSAKPLGLGSIAVSVNRVTLRTIKENGETQCIERRESTYDQYSKPEFDENIEKQFSKMTNFTVLQGENIDYPRTEKDGEIYQWFTENHVKKEKNGDYSHKMPNSRRQMAYAEYMEPMDPELKSTKQHRGNGNGNYKNYKNNHRNGGKRNS